MVCIETLSQVSMAASCLLIRNTCLLNRGTIDLLVHQRKEFAFKTGFTMIFVIIATSQNIKIKKKTMMLDLYIYVRYFITKCML